MNDLNPDKTSHLQQTSARPINPKYGRFLGVFLGVLYGLVLRLLWDTDFASTWGSLVSISFMFLMPVAIGAIRIFFELRNGVSVSWSKAIISPWLSIFVFLIVCFVTLLEGSICIALALPVFMALASLGGVIMRGCHAVFCKKGQQNSLYSMALLPLLFSPVETQFIHLANTYEVKNQITIAAPVDVVWQQLANVDDIQEDELPFSLNELMGVPRPLRADMALQANGATRTSVWDKGVVFKEEIYDWQPNKAMRYRFDIDPDHIPDHALDKHVKLGGEYFSPLYGAYELSSLDHNTTMLTLRTTLRDNTNFGLYSRIWGEVIFRDFHRMLLVLMKNRSEATQ